MNETSGWVTYGAVMMAIVGTLNVIYGIVLLANEDWIAVLSTGEVVFFNTTTWGWILLIIGVIELFAGWGIITGQAWARIIGVIVATLGLVSGFLSLNIYPWWSLTVMVLAFLVIYGLVVHGDEVAEA